MDFNCEISIHTQISIHTCGLTTVKALQAARDVAHVTGLMQLNRIGLPRRYLQQLKRKLNCTRGCKHATGQTGCIKWAWTILHKGEWELHIWADKKLVVAMTSCASGTRLVELTRPLDNLNREYAHVLVPEAIGFYNVFGRGATDGGDGERKRLSLSARRRLRQGPKHALSELEICFVNGVVLA